MWIGTTHFEQIMGHGVQKMLLQKPKCFVGLELDGDKVVDDGSGIQTGILDFGHLNLMLLDLLIKRASGYT